MLFLVKIVLNEYKTLVFKMHQDSKVNNQIAHNLKLFCDLQVMLGFSCLVPMFKGLNELIKFI
jgi:hypothetical protein